MIRFGWLLIAASIVAVLAWADKYAGGILPKEVSCAFALSREDRPPAEVLLFGSSRTGTAFNPQIINDSLAVSSLTEPVKVEKLNITGADPKAMLSLLRRYMADRGKPKLIVVEIPLSLKNDPRKPVRGLFTDRNYSYLSFSELYHLRTNFSVGDLPGRFTQILNSFGQRATNLLHGVLRDPFGNNWKRSKCSTGDITRDGVWAWGAAGSPAISPAKGVRRARQILRLKEPTSDPAWSLLQKAPHPAKYDVNDNDRRFGVFLLRQLVDLAAANGIQVLLVPLVNINTYVSEADRKFFLDLGDNVSWFDVYRQAGSILENYWRDPLHTHLLASPLLSYMLANRLESIFKDD